MGSATGATSLGRFASSINRTLRTLRFGLATVAGASTTSVATIGRATGALTVALALRTRRCTARLARVTRLFVLGRADTTGNAVHGFA